MLFLFCLIFSLILASDDEDLQDISEQEATNLSQALTSITSLAPYLTDDVIDFVIEINRGEKLYKSFLASKCCLKSYFQKDKDNKTYPFKKEVNEALVLRNKYITSGFKEELFPSAEEKEQAVNESAKIIIKVLMRLGECIERAFNLSSFPKEILDYMYKVQELFFYRMMRLEARIMQLSEVPLQTLRQAKLAQNNAQEPLLDEKREGQKKKLTFAKGIKVVEYELEEGKRFKRKTPRRWSSSDITDPLFQDRYEEVGNTSLSSDIDKPYPTVPFMDMDGYLTLFFQKTLPSMTSTQRAFIESRTRVISGSDFKPCLTPSPDRYLGEAAGHASLSSIEEDKVSFPTSVQSLKRKEKNPLTSPFYSDSIEDQISEYVSNLALNDDQQEQQLSIQTDGISTQSGLLSG